MKFVCDLFSIKLLSRISMAFWNLGAFFLFLITLPWFTYIRNSQRFLLYVKEPLLIHYLLNRVYINTRFHYSIWNNICNFKGNVIIDVQNKWFSYFFSDWKANTRVAHTLNFYVGGKWSMLVYGVETNKLKPILYEQRNNTWYQSRGTPLEILNWTIKQTWPTFLNFMFNTLR